MTIEPVYPSVSESIGLRGGAATSNKRKSTLKAMSVTREYAPLVRLSDRALRNGNLWRTVALMADQAAEAEAKWPNSITAVNARRDFTAALTGLVRLHNEFWTNESTREHADVRTADILAEQTWLTRNGAKSA